MGVTTVHRLTHHWSHHDSIVNVNVKSRLVSCKVP